MNRREKILAGGVGGIVAIFVIGFGVRAAVGSYDRGHTAVSQLKPGDINWDEIFGKHGARWFHTGGIFSALSTTTPEVVLEAVQAAKAMGLRASEDLGRALRYAFFAESRTISLVPVILDVAKRCASVDVEVLAEALDDGRARAMVVEQRETAERIGVKGSPHVYVPDGTDLANPGVDKHWEGDEGEGFPVIDGYDSTVYEDLIRRAASR